MHHILSNTTIETSYMTSCMYIYIMSCECTAAFLLYGVESSFQFQFFHQLFTCVVLIELWWCQSSTMMFTLFLGFLCGWIESLCWWRELGNLCSFFVFSRQHIIFAVVQPDYKCHMLPIYSTVCYNSCMSFFLCRVTV